MSCWAKLFCGQKSLRRLFLPFMSTINFSLARFYEFESNKADKNKKDTAAEKCPSKQNQKPLCAIKWINFLQLLFWWVVKKLDPFDWKVIFASYFQTAQLYPCSTDGAVDSNSRQWSCTDLVPFGGRYAAATFGVNLPRSLAFCDTSWVSCTAWRCSSTDA